MKVAVPRDTGRTRSYDSSRDPRWCEVLNLNSLRMSGRGMVGCGCRGGWLGSQKPLYGIPRTTSGLLVFAERSISSAKQCEHGTYQLTDVPMSFNHSSNQHVFLEASIPPIIPTWRPRGSLHSILRDVGGSASCFNKDLYDTNQRGAQWKQMLSKRRG
ncbi:hypothetical protein BD410DRAFT_441960 [Rickenella mellea]|uniref:Uncharacterized protein n=1 Tax=Rickenella mellea TaxID=50990 RepID=A0A4Y7PX07_9AGAM|nr:hypothetical protein BD410DRAFT_441960 [Rickenella mellea]